MTRPLILDLFCGAGGAAKGYHRAGFDIIGIDIEPQPRYPFEFHQLNAMHVLRAGAWWTGAPDLGLGQRHALTDFHAIHASPPCQAWTAYKRRRGHVATRPNHIPEVRHHLRTLDVPWVIENIPDAPLEHGITLCGSSFGLDVRRHRRFESNVAMLAPPCNHGAQTPQYPPATNRHRLRRTVEVGVWRIPLDVQRQAMGIDWMTRDELSQAIPPAYTEYIGTQLLHTLEATA